MLRSWACSAGALLLVPMVLGCGAEGAAPSEEPALLNRLVFETEGGIGVMAVDGSQRHTLPIGSDLEGAWSPAVSPDGRRVVFTGSKSGQLDLYVMNVDGSARKQLTNDLAQDLGPTWAPDGGSLLFHWVGTATGSPTMLVVIGADGGGRRELLVDGWGGHWSADGRRVAFTGVGSRARGVYVMDADGSNETSLREVCGAECDDIAPRWSPDGQFLAFTRLLPDGSQAAGVMRADGSEARLVLPTLHTAGPVWSPDGQRLALTRLDEGLARIYVVTLGSTDTVRLAVGGLVTDWTQ
jgi:Tol biopolymer transport system component